jgi:hypothetical protein
MDAAFKLCRVAERAGNLAEAWHWAGYLRDQGAGEHPGFARGFAELCGRLWPTPGQAYEGSNV